MTLDKIQGGRKCIIKNLSASGNLLHKLLDMGFIQGSIVEVVRFAPLKDPIELKIHDYLISLRRSEAGLIEVEKYD